MAALNWTLCCNLQLGHGLLLSKLVHIWGLFITTTSLLNLTCKVYNNCKMLTEMVSPREFTMFSLLCWTGLLIPANCVSPLINKLSTSDQSQQLAVQEQQKRQQLHPQSLSHAPSTGALGIMGASIPSPSFWRLRPLSPVSALQSPGSLHTSSPDASPSPHTHALVPLGLWESVVSRWAVMTLRVRNSGCIEKISGLVCFYFLYISRDFFFFLLSHLEKLWQVMFCPLTFRVKTYVSDCSESSRGRQPVAVESSSQLSRLKPLFFLFYFFFLNRLLWRRGFLVCLARWKTTTCFKSLSATVI